MNLASGTILKQFGHRFIDFGAHGKWSQQSRDFHSEALKTLQMLWLPSASPIDPTMVVHLDPMRGIIISGAPELLW